MKLKLQNGQQVVEHDFSDTPWSLQGDQLVNQRTGRRLPVRIAQLDERRYQIWLSGQLFQVELAASGPRRAGADASHSNENSVKAQMPGTILAVKVKPGDSVNAGQTLIVMESMKMELNLESPRAGVVGSLAIEAGQLVELGALLLELEPA